MKLNVVQRLQLGVIYAILGVFVLIESPRPVVHVSLARSLRVILFAGLVYFALNISVYKRNIDYIADYLFYVPSQSILVTPKVIAPKQVTALPFPDVSAQGIVVADLRSNTILYERNKSVKYPPASTTKVMTALVASELFPQHSTFTVDYSCTQIPSQKVGFVSGELLSLSDLLQSLLIASAGDAACVLAQTHSPVSFVTRMNMMAKSLGMNNTKFSNAIGLDDFEHGQESTPYDLYLMTRQALANNFISDTVKIKELTIESLQTSMSANYSHSLVNTNKLLWEIPESAGFKTGKTDGAKEVLIYLYTKEDRDLVIIVMQSEDRFEDTKKILNWVLASFVWD
ncbi:MAG: hypothetical protein RLY61_860 [Candidatus Parcubacteria bacterium]